MVWSNCATACRTRSPNGAECYANERCRNASSGIIHVRRHRDGGENGMTIGTIDESQRKAATVVGFSYLFALPPAIFAEFYVLGRLIVSNNAVDTARNIMAH